jgi:hypothetical protein
MELTHKAGVVNLQLLPERLAAVVSAHHWFPASLGLLAIAAVFAVGSVSAADFQFHPIDHAAARAERGSLSCWRWHAGIGGSAPVCRAGADRDDSIPYAPPPDRAPVHYDYPSYGPGVAGSSLSFVVGRHGRDDLRPPPHAE